MKERLNWICKSKRDKVPLSCIPSSVASKKKSQRAVLLFLCIVAFLARMSAKHQTEKSKRKAAASYITKLLYRQRKRQTPQIKSIIGWKSENSVLHLWHAFYKNSAPPSANQQREIAKHCRILEKWDYRKFYFQGRVFLSLPSSLLRLTTSFANSQGRFHQSRNRTGKWCESEN